MPAERDMRARIVPGLAAPGHPFAATRALTVISAIALDVTWVSIVITAIALSLAPVSAEVAGAQGVAPQVTAAQAAAEGAPPHVTVAQAAAKDFAGETTPMIDENVAQALHMATRYAGLVRETVAILAGRPDADTIWATLYDARRAVAEIDRVAANAAILQASQRDRRHLLDLSAEAHLNLALFETHGLEFERARREIDRAHMISEHIEHPNFRTPWAAFQSGRPGRALVTRYHLLSLNEFEAALGSILHRVRQVPFEFHGHSTQDLLEVRLIRSDEPADDTLDARLLSLGLARMRQELEKGLPSFTVPLPPGLYRLQGSPAGVSERSFMVPEVTTVDTIVIDRARFTLQLDPKLERTGVRFFLNGIEVHDMTSVPYGVYRLKVDEAEFPTAPKIVEFVLGEGTADKTRTSWMVFVPGGGSYLFQLDRGYRR